MANGRQPVGIGRKILAAVVGTVATFITLFGLGMSSGSIVVLGVVLLALAIGLVAFPGLGSGARVWVAGTAYVRSVSDPPASAEYGRCEMHVLVDAPGLPPQSIKIRDPRVPVAKWPEPGATLPITVALDDPRHIRVMWEEVLTHAEAATQPDPHTPPPREDPLDDLLIDEPPWARRAPEDDLPPTPPADPAPTGHADPPDRPADEPTQPVVLHHPPGGPIVLEGTVVATPPVTIPLPRQGEPSTGSGATPDDPGHAERAVATAIEEDTRTLVVDAPAPPTPHESATPDRGGTSNGSTPAINGVGITMLVADLERSLAFYRDVLGFTEIDSGDGNAVLASGGVRVVLRAIRDIAPINRRLVHLNLEVDNLEAAYAELHEKGVRFTYAPRVVNRGERLELWAAAFRDPDGHGIAITQWRELAGSQA